MEAIIAKRNEGLDLPYRVDLSFGPLVNLCAKICLVGLKIQEERR